VSDRLPRPVQIAQGTREKEPELSIFTSAEKPLEERDSECSLPGSGKRDGVLAPHPVIVGIVTEIKREERNGIGQALLLQQRKDFIPEELGRPSSHEGVRSRHWSGSDQRRLQRLEGRGRVRKVETAFLEPCTEHEALGQHEKHQHECGRQQ
jgi:hypothetical protein